MEIVKNPSENHFEHFILQRAERKAIRRTTEGCITLLIILVLSQQVIGGWEAASAVILVAFVLTHSAVLKIRRRCTKFYFEFLFENMSRFACPLITCCHVSTQNVL